MSDKVRCATCDMVCDAATSLVVIIETDTGGTLVSRRIDEDETRFMGRYHSLVDSGKYPNMSRPQIECKSCRTIRYKEMEEEMEYWNNRLERY